MDAFKCDRCGKYQYGMIPNRIVLKPITDIEIEDIKLCDECFDAVWEFVKSLHDIKT